MGMGFIDIILSWILSEGRVWWAAIWHGKGYDRYGNRNKSICLGRITTAMDIDMFFERHSFAMSTISCPICGLGFLST